MVTGKLTSFYKFGHLQSHVKTNSWSSSKSLPRINQTVKSGNLHIQRTEHSSSLANIKNTQIHYILHTPVQTFTMVAITNILCLVSAVSASAILGRDAAKVLSDLQGINTDVTSLITATNNYNGGGAGNAAPIISAEATLDKAIKAATTDATNEGTLTVAQGQSQLSYITNTLEPNIEKAISALEAKKADFTTDGLIPTVCGDLKQLKTDTDALGAQLISHSPASLVSQAQAEQAKIDSDYAGAISFFAC